mgnify:CR=1 FL=1
MHAPFGSVTAKVVRPAGGRGGAVGGLRGASNGYASQRRRGGPSALAAEVRWPCRGPGAPHAHCSLRVAAVVTTASAMSPATRFTVENPTQLALSSPSLRVGGRGAGAKSSGGIQLAVQLVGSQARRWAAV